jgi:hypothetical protein
MPYLFQMMKDAENLKDGVIPDGGVISVRLNMMDSLQFAVSSGTQFDGNLEAAYQRREHDLTNAWRTPAAVNDGQAAAPKQDGYRAVTRDELDRLYDKRDQEVSQAWKTPAPRIMLDDSKKKVVTRATDAGDPEARRAARDTALENAWRT